MRANGISRRLGMVTGLRVLHFLPLAPARSLLQSNAESN